MGRVMRHLEAVAAQYASLLRTTAGALLTMTDEMDARALSMAQSPRRASVAQCLDEEPSDGETACPLRAVYYASFTSASSCQCSDEVEDHAGGAAGAEGRDHAEFEAENRAGGRDRERQGPHIDARQLRCVERKAEALHRRGLAEYGVHREPDCEVENDADDRRGDRRERRIQGLVVAQLLGEGRAEEDPEETRHEGGSGGEQAAERAGECGRKRAGITVGAHERDELQDLDQ